MMVHPLSTGRLTRAFLRPSSLSSLAVGLLILPLACDLPSAMGLPGGQTGGTPRIANDTLNAEQLATFLGIDAWVFAYEGKLERCWVEIHEEGQKTVGPEVFASLEPPRGDTPAPGGKILLFLRRGEMKLFLETGKVRSAGVVTLGQDDLWWGWKGSYYGSSGRLQRTVTPEAGKDVVLVTYSQEQAPGSAANAPPPKKVQLQLKARFGE
jgi:hypothetical protein